MYQIYIKAQNTMTPVLLNIMYMQMELAGYLEILMSKPHQRNLPVPFFSQRENHYSWQRIARAGEKKADGTRFFCYSGMAAFKKAYPPGDIDDIVRERRIEFTDWQSLRKKRLELMVHYSDDRLPVKIPEEF
jgi:hypothetical protein